MSINSNLTSMRFQALCERKLKWKTLCFLPQMREDNEILFLRLTLEIRTVSVHE